MAQNLLSSRCQRLARDLHRTSHQIDESDQGRGKHRSKNLQQAWCVRRYVTMRPRLLSIATGLAMATFAVGAGSAKADIIFGNVNPSPACLAAPAGQVGHVCGITETFTSPAGDNIVANGFSGAPAPGVGNRNLTLKGGPAAPAPLLPTNALSESGLGTNANATATCSNPECEMASPTSVTAVVGAGGN